MHFGGGERNGTNDDSNSTATTQTTEENTSTLIEKEGKADNIWRTVGSFANIRTQRNYDRVVKKQTLAEIEDFEEKVEAWANKYINFVDDGVNRKQPRY